MQHFTNALVWFHVVAIAGGAMIALIRISAREPETVEHDLGKVAFAPRRAAPLAA